MVSPTRRERDLLGEREVPRQIHAGYTQVYGFPGVSCVTILSK